MRTANTHTASTLPAGLAQHGFAALLAWVVGAALQLQQAALWHWGFYALFVLLALVLIAQAAIINVATSGRRVWLIVAMLLLGMGATGLRATVYTLDTLESALEGRDVRVTGVVSGLPQRSEAGLRFRLQVEAALLNGVPVAVPPRVDVGWYGAGASPTSMDAVPDVQVGERWHMTLRLKAPHGSRNPHGFDYELWLWEQGVQATGYVRTGAQDAPPQRLAQTWRHPVDLARQQVRQRIAATVADRQRAGMISALVVGDQNAIDRADWDVFRATGVAHLVSISGLHITMFAWGAALVLGWLWRRSQRLCLLLPAPSAALVGGVLLACAYAVFSGWGVPAQRTCVMLGTVAFLRLSGSRWPWPQVWMLACAVVVAADPWALLQPGFWLSFVAVGVLFATDLGAASAHSTRATGQNNAKFLAQGGPGFAGRSAMAMASVVAMLREQWVITLALAPLTLLLFGQVSVVGLVANALAIPWVTLVLTPLAMLGVAVPALWEVAAGAAGWLLVWLQWLAAFPWAALLVAVPPLWAGVAATLGAVVLVAPLPWSMRVLGVPLLLPVLLWRAPLPAVGEFELLAADVGQGNAVLVRTASHALLYDAGPRYSLESDAGHRVLLPLLQALHTRLDTVVLSHRVADHVGGAAAVLGMQPQAQLLSSIEASHPLQALRPTQRCVAGQAWVWDGVQFEVLHPQAGDYDTTAKPNALSCVLRISSNGPNGVRTALLVGDIERAQEVRLVAQHDSVANDTVASLGATSLRADVLLVPHHGSKTSSSAEFLDAVQPRWALVQAGYRNRFGHPAPAVLERYAERNIAVFSTPQCGAFTWQSWHTEGVSCTRQQGQRYWHHRVP